MPNTTHCRYLSQLAGITSPHDQICHSFLKLLNTMLNSDNKIVKFIAERAVKDHRNIISGNISYIETVYKKPLTDFSSLPELKSYYLPLEEQCTVQAVRDILIYNPLDLSPLDKCHFLYFLCTI